MESGTEKNAILKNLEVKYNIPVCNTDYQKKNQY